MHSWLDQLLRPLLQISSLLHIEADRRPSDTLGSTQVQTPTATTEARANMVGWRGQTHAVALPPLAASVCKRPDAGSRMSREAHVRFWERAVVKFRRATRLERRGSRRWRHGAANPSPQRQHQPRDQCRLRKSCAAAARCAVRRWRRLFQQPVCPIGQSGVTPRAPRDICGPSFAGSRRPHELWERHCRCVASSRRLCRPHPQGREARRLAGGAGVQVRTGHQCPDRPDARAHRAGEADRHRRRGDRVRRRAFITLLGGAAATWPLAARAQQPAMPVIGYLSSLGQAISVRFDAAFRRGLSDVGYVEGQNVSVEYRWITDRYDALPAMAADLVQRQVAVIFALGPPAVLAAKAASPTIPIVFVTGADPLRFGFVASFNKPGGTITGIWMVLTALAEKRLQLMHDLLPKAELIGLLVNPASPVAEPQIREAQAAANVLGVRLTVLRAVSENDFDQVFVSLAQQRADALFVSADPFFASKREHLVALAAQHAMPATYDFREFVEAGGLMSYGTVLSDGFYKGGNYVGRVLKGTKPADLPVEQVNKFELVLNLKTAKTLGLTVPDNLLGLADEVIEEGSLLLRLL